MITLHYSLGLAPQRSGGLTIYATDLIKEQQKTKDVALLYPSGWRWWSQNIVWRKQGLKNGIDTYVLRNSLPIPLLGGVKSPSDLIEGRMMSEKEMETLYEAIKPDVFHVHTLMGLPKELLLFFKSKGVRLIYTSHDYFGICPKVNLINERGELCSGPTAESCKRCNIDAKSTLFLRIRNSRLALSLKNNPLLRKLLK